MIGVAEQRRPRRPCAHRCGHPCHRPPISALATACRSAAAPARRVA